MPSCKSSSCNPYGQLPNDWTLSSLLFFSEASDVPGMDGLIQSGAHVCSVLDCGGWNLGWLWRSSLGYSLFLWGQQLGRGPKSLLSFFSWSSSKSDGWTSFWAEIFYLNTFPLLAESLSIENHKDIKPRFLQIRRKKAGIRNIVLELFILGLLSEVPARLVLNSFKNLQEYFITVSPNEVFTSLSLEQETSFIWWH